MVKKLYYKGRALHLYREWCATVTCGTTVFHTQRPTSYSYLQTKYKEVSVGLLPQQREWFNTD